MSYLTSIEINGATKPAATQDFSGPPGAFPLARYELALIRGKLNRGASRRGRRK